MPASSEVETEPSPLALCGDIETPFGLSDEGVETLALPPMGGGELLMKVAMPARWSKEFPLANCE